MSPSFEALCAATEAMAIAALSGEAPLSGVLPLFVALDHGERRLAGKVGKRVAASVGLNVQVAERPYAHDGETVTLAVFGR